MYWPACPISGCIIPQRNVARGFVTSENPVTSDRAMTYRTMARRHMICL
jgi:hypothetical protein